MGQGGKEILADILSIWMDKLKHGKPPGRAMWHSSFIPLVKNGKIDVRQCFLLFYFVQLVDD